MSSTSDHLAIRKASLAAAEQAARQWNCRTVLK